MRIHWNKVYRAFPELDRFDDRKCLEFIELACHKFWVSRLIVGAAGLLFCIATLVGLIVGLNTILDAVFFCTVAERLRSPYYLWLWGSGVATIGTLVGVFGMLIRDRWLRWAVSTQIVSARCLHCQYSLLGLAAEDGSVICPECGKQTNLAARGLSPESLLMEGQIQEAE